MTRTTVEVPEDLRRFFDEYCALIVNRRQRYIRAVWWVIPSTLLWLFLVAMGAISMPAGSHWLALLLLAPVGILDLMTRGQGKRVEAIKQIFKTRGFRICHDMGLRADVLVDNA